MVSSHLLHTIYKCPCFPCRCGGRSCRGPAEASVRKSHVSHRGNRVLRFTEIKKIHFTSTLLPKQSTSAFIYCIYLYIYIYAFFPIDFFCPFQGRQKHCPDVCGCFLSLFFPSFFLRKKPAQTYDKNIQRKTKETFYTYNHTRVYCGLQRLNNKPVFIKADSYNTTLNNNSDGLWAGLWVGPRGVDTPTNYI